MDRNDECGIQGNEGYSTVEASKVSTSGFVVAFSLVRYFFNPMENLKIFPNIKYRRGYDSCTYSPTRKFKLKEGNSMETGRSRLSKSIRLETLRLSTPPVVGNPSSDPIK